MGKKKRTGLIKSGAGGFVMRHASGQDYHGWAEEGEYRPLSYRSRVWRPGDEQAAARELIADLSLPLRDAFLLLRAAFGDRALRGATYWSMASKTLTDAEKRRARTLYLLTKHSQLALSCFWAGGTVSDVRARIKEVKGESKALELEERWGGTCPVCGELPGEPCVALASGHLLGHPHKGRLKRSDVTPETEAAARAKLERGREKREARIRREKAQLARGAVAEAKRKAEKRAARQAGQEARREAQQKEAALLARAAQGRKRVTGLPRAVLDRPVSEAELKRLGAPLRALTDRLELSTVEDFLAVSSDELALFDMPGLTSSSLHRFDRWRSRLASPPLPARGKSNRRRRPRRARVNGDLVRGPWRWCWEAGLVPPEGGALVVASGEAVDVPAAVRQAAAALAQDQGRKPRLQQVWVSDRSPFGPPAGRIDFHGWVPLDAEEDRGLELLVRGYGRAVQETAAHFGFRTSFQPNYLGMKYLIFPWDDIPPGRKYLSGERGRAEVATFFRARLAAGQEVLASRLVNKAIDVMEGIGASPPVYVALTSCSQ